MDLNETLENLRVRYQASSLDIVDTDENPIVQFDKWLEQAIKSRCDEPNAFVLSTANQGQPRSRVVLLKGIHDERFIFYTNYNSSKANEISINHKAAMTFLWLPLQRQVRVEGIVTKVPDTMSEAYFQKRPRGSQLGAIASPQSTKVKDRKALENLFQETEEKFKGQEILPRPLFWGGYAITPSYVEFWQGRDNRMHDRICYELTSDCWLRSRLAP
jgi:pyridoxamine 5'-phosphate oxidase